MKRSLDMNWIGQVMRNGSPRGAINRKYTFSSPEQSILLALQIVKQASVFLSHCQSERLAETLEAMDESDRAVLQGYSSTVPVFSLTVQVHNSYLLDWRCNWLSRLSFIFSSGLLCWTPEAPYKP